MTPIVRKPSDSCSRRLADCFNNARHEDVHATRRRLPDQLLQEQAADADRVRPRAHNRVLGGAVVRAVATMCTIGPSQLCGHRPLPPAPDNALPRSKPFEPLRRVFARYRSRRAVQHFLIVNREDAVKISAGRVAMITEPPVRRGRRDTDRAAPAGSVSEGNVTVSRVRVNPDRAGTLPRSVSV